MWARPMLYLDRPQKIRSTSLFVYLSRICWWAAYIVSWSILSIFVYSFFIKLFNFFPMTVLTVVIRLVAQNICIKFQKSVEKEKRVILLYCIKLYQNSVEKRLYSLSRLMKYFWYFADLLTAQVPCHQGDQWQLRWEQMA